MADKFDDSIAYDFHHYEDPTLGFKPTNKTHLLMEVSRRLPTRVHHVKSITYFRFYFSNTLKIHDVLGELTESLSWEIGTVNLDNQTAFRALELMWWLDSSDWITLYDTIKIGTSYSQETIQFVRFLPGRPSTGGFEL